MILRLFSVSFSGFETVPENMPLASTHHTVAEKFLALGSSRHFHAITHSVKRSDGFSKGPGAQFQVKGRKRNSLFFYQRPVRGDCKASSKLPEVEHGRFCLCSTKLICLGAGRFPGPQLLLTSSSARNWENLPVQLLRPCWQHCPLKNPGEAFSSLHLLPFLPFPLPPCQF